MSIEGQPDFPAQESINFEGMNERLDTARERAHNILMATAHSDEEKVARIRDEYLNTDTQLADLANMLIGATNQDTRADPARYRGIALAFLDIQSDSGARDLLDERA
ncbi:MAG: hypothetical protein UY39_C0050G0006 [Candidatus Kaiserbacteria bacterium GW2011_GWC2_49_12]|uniref:Uncharacterized protein n=1 Tax=Candidatus Kaiserbacteria bacterium GW2011_GWC2_49_12 TaxID=1618675 RepID=A0A0G1VHQ7_9BACT|nr:MAG: hypothetical protein UY39_C0050G0006 [Candidatus Kaiserbacteria bacterium GW2011_GWC2_49_12]HCM43500.1 hypothetical protein [Candidatus Kaiserbacteria bacterium]